MENRKQAVSIRMSASDVRKIKRLAERLGVRDSDIIRFAVKSMLGRLGPLHDPTTRGRDLMPVFLDHGRELSHHFDLDAARLEAIVNESADEGSRVDRKDIQLLAMGGIDRPYDRWIVEPRSARTRSPDPADDTRVNGKASHNEVNESEKSVSLRAYLFEKYLYGDGGPV
jgi:hypothetical protein